LEGQLQSPVHALELVAPHFYHLDTCFCPLDDKRVLYDPDAFSPASREIIQEFIPQPIIINEADALRFAANAIVVGNHVVMNAGSDSLAETLIGEGFIVHALDFSEFMKAGGSAKCLVLQLPNLG
jgi:N-dimethylarginine dimethylaminohydrolase